MYDVPTELVHNVANINISDGPQLSGGAGNLLPPVSKPLHRGGKLLNFKLDKWGFKNDVAKVRAAPEGVHAACTSAIASRLQTA